MGMKARPQGGASFAWRSVSGLHEWQRAVHGRVLFLLHAMRGHDVTWRTPPNDLPLCAADIACRTCDAVVWCRELDPWRPASRLRQTERARAITVTPGVPPGEGGDPTLRDQRVAHDPTLGMSPAQERLSRLLTLAGRLPAGTSEDHVRRCVCEVIEAEAPEFPERVGALLQSIVRLQHERRHGLRRAQQAGAPAIERLLTALYDDVVPMVGLTNADKLDTRGA
jgi:hypothetical protein